MTAAKFAEAVKWVREHYPLPWLELLDARDRAVRSAEAIRDGSLEIDDAPPEGASEYAQWIVLEAGDVPLAGYLRRNLRQPVSRGRPARTGRDRVFILAIGAVCEDYGLSETRKNRDGPSECCAEGGSGCDVVGAALPGKIKHGQPRFLSYSRVRSIWGERQKTG